MELVRFVRTAGVVALVTAAIVACAGADAAPSESIAGIDDGRRHVACVGDSITAGDGASLWSTAYPARLQSLLGDGYAVENDGHSGATMLKNGSHPYWSTAELAASTAFTAHGGEVVIMLGTNDAQAANWALKDEFVADCEALVDHYRATSQATRVWISLPPPAASSACCATASNLENGVVPMLVECAAAKYAPTIDVRGAFDDDLSELLDGVHPNAAGVERIARTVRDALVNVRPVVQ